MFHVTAEDVTIRDVRCTELPHPVTTFILLEVAHGAVVEGCRAGNGADAWPDNFVAVVPTAPSYWCSIARNRHVQSAITGPLRRSQITFNDALGATLELTDGRWNIIIGNELEGGLINTAASLGDNMVGGNRGEPTLTLHATDEVFGSGSGGAGDVVGPASSTNNGVARFDGTTGKLIQGSSVTISDVGDLSVAAGLTVASVAFAASFFASSTVSAALIDATATGVKFPDDTVQTTAAAPFAGSDVSAPITGDGVNTPLALPRATSGVDGYLDADDFAAFSAKGDLSGPASSVDNAVPRFDGTTGKLFQGSALTIDDDAVATLTGPSYAVLEATAPSYAGTGVRLTGAGEAEIYANGGATNVARLYVDDTGSADLDLTAINTSARIVADGNTVHDINGFIVVQPTLDLLVGGSTVETWLETRRTTNVATEHKVHSGYAGSGRVETTAAVTTTDATPTVIASFTPETASVHSVEVDVVGVGSGGERCHYRVMQTCRENSGAELLGTMTTLHSYESHAGLAVSFNTNGDDVEVLVTGLAATTVKWVCSMRRQGVL